MSERHRKEIHAVCLTGIEKNRFTQFVTRRYRLKRQTDVNARMNSASTDGAGPDCRRHGPPLVKDTTDDREN